MSKVKIEYLLKFKKIIIFNIILKWFEIYSLQWNSIDSTLISTTLAIVSICSSPRIILYHVLDFAFLIRLKFHWFVVKVEFYFIAILFSILLYDINYFIACWILSVVKYQYYLLWNIIYYISNIFEILNSTFKIMCVVVKEKFLRFAKGLTTTVVHIYNVLCI